jgi:hypothetical protein
MLGWPARRCPGRRPPLNPPHRRRTASPARSLPDDDATNPRRLLMVRARFHPAHHRRPCARFCSPSCRRAFDAAGRRFAAEALACGLLTLDQIRDGPAATRALLPGGISPPAESPTPVASPESLSEAGELLADLVFAMINAPGWSDPTDTLWSDVVAALPDGLFDRIDAYFTER